MILKDETDSEVTSIYVEFYMKAFGITDDDDLHRIAKRRTLLDGMISLRGHCDLGVSSSDVRQEQGNCGEGAKNMDTPSFRHRPEDIHSINPRAYQGIVNLRVPVKFFDALVVMGKK